MASGHEAVEKTAALVVAFAVLAYFSAREVGQMKAARDRAGPAGGSMSMDAEGLAFCRPADPAAPRALRGGFAVSSGLSRAHRPGVRREKYAMDTTSVRMSWFDETIIDPILHDPLTFLGLPRAWRGILELDRRRNARLRLGRLRRAATPGTNLSTDLAAATAMLLWLRLFGFLKNINQALRRSC